MLSLRRSKKPQSLLLKTTEANVKIYRVIDDGDCVLTTVNELTALRKFEEIMTAHDATAGWIDVEEVK